MVRKNAGPKPRRITGMRKPGASKTAATKMSSMNARTAYLGGSGSIQLAMEKVRGPLDRFTASHIPFDVNDPSERSKIRELCRIYYRTHNLMSTAIDMYARLPVQGMEIKCKDPDIQRFYEDLFFEQLDYKKFLVQAGVEYFTIGEVNMMASFDENLGVFEYESILNPDDLTVTQALFNPNEFRYHLKVPAHIREIIETREPRADYETLVDEYPEIVDAARKENSGMTTDSVLGEGFEVSPMLLSRIVNSPFGDLYGTPMMMRAFVLLNLEEGLYAAQKAVADRLYAPLILAKLGSPDLGDGEPWLPSEEQLQSFTDMMQQAMSADFRFLAYHFGIEIESVFGRESVPRFDQDFDRLEAKMLQVWGIGESLLSGAQDGAYASSALNAETLTQLLSYWQTQLKDHFQRRAEVIAEAQKHYDYEEVNGERTIIQESYNYVDDDGEVHVRQRPKLLLPTLEFASLNTRDEAADREAMMALKQAGVPISDSLMMTNLPWELEEQIEMVANEKKKKVLAEAAMKESLIIALNERGLKPPPELISPAPVSQPIMNDIAAPVNTPNMALDPNAMAFAQQNADAQGDPISPGPAPMTPMSPGSIPSAPSAPGSFGGFGQNPVPQRPAISDNMRANMPKAAKKQKNDPVAN